MVGGIRGLLLDADGTLWDTASAMVGAGAAGARAVWPQIPDAVALAFAQRWRADPAGYFRRFVAGDLGFEAMREGRFGECVSALALPEVDGAAAAFTAGYAPAFAGLLRPYSDAVRLLVRCAAASLPVRVLTNSTAEYTAEKLKMTGLQRLDGLVCSRDCLGVGKPDPAVYRHASDRLGVEVGEVLYVGDELEPDALGPRAAGLQALWLVRDDADPNRDVAATPARRRQAQAHGIRIIDSLDEVPV